jgi:predicted GNAT family acetyltransferase
MTDQSRRDEDLDETLEETFPASDPPGNTIETGVRVDLSPVHEHEVRDRPEAGRFEIAVDGGIAFLTYERRPGAFVLRHTEVPESLRGRGLAQRLAAFGVAAARASGLPMVVECPFVRKYLEKNG